jgi:RNA recognition motif-containing protein
MSVMNIYVGNLSYQMSESELRDAFAAFGEVSSVKILMDRETGRSRGFGFVEMPNQSEGEAAIAQLNGKDLGGRALRINEARPRERR